jgi:flagellar motor switch protein FliN/FliY
LPDPNGKLGGTDWLTGEWLDKLASSVEMMTELRPGLSPGARIAAGSQEIPADALWFSIPLNLAENAAVLIGAAAESWLNIGKSGLQAAGVTDVTPEDARSTYLEIITQATSGLAQSIAERVGKPVASQPAKEVKPGAPDFGDTSIVSPIEVSPIEVSPIEVSLRDASLGKLYLGWSNGLELALAPAKSSAGEAAAPVLAGGMRPPLEKSRTFDLLMEVELPVSVSFGRAQLPLRDVLKLTSGSIVELNRTITDLVEIIVNNCVIARGEVVVVEGNYGVRIKQVISREERLRTLK